MEYKVSELAEKAGVTKRTIHYYISKGLLLPPEGSGVNSVYNDEHLNRILLIKKLQSEYMPLNKIREYILENPTEEIREYSLEYTEKNPKLKLQEETSEYNSEKNQISGSGKEIYIRENVCDIFEMNYSQENGEKYKHIIENVKKYVEKMLED